MNEPEMLIEGVVFGESVRWHDGRVWFSDWGRREIVAVDLAGNREVVMELSTFPFSFDWLPDGRLAVVSNDVVCRDADGLLAVHGRLDALAPAWNEIVADARGNLYVNQAGFDLMGGGEPTSGTIATVTAGGVARTVAEDVWFPNGMAITADGATLLVAESYRKRLSAFDVSADGTLTNRRVWAELGEGVPDGICLDDEGAIWYADVPNQCCVRVREGGEVLQTIRLDRGCFSCMLGGTVGRTLFIAATQWRGPAQMFQGEPTGRIMMVDVDVPHAGRP